MVADTRHFKQWLLYIKAECAKNELSTIFDTSIVTDTESIQYKMAAAYVKRIQDTRENEYKRNEVARSSIDLDAETENERNDRITNENKTIVTLKELKECTFHQQFINDFDRKATKIHEKSNNAISNIIKPNCGTKALQIIQTIETSFLTNDHQHHHRIKLFKILDELKNNLLDV